MKLIRFLLPRIEYILFAAIFWGIAATGPILLNSDGDLPRHLLVGKLIRTAREVSLTDIFSYRTTRFPSIPHEWLSQVILSSSYDLLGLSGVVLFTALIVTIIWSIIYYDALRRSNSLFISLAFTGLGVGASLIHILPRLICSVMYLPYFGFSFWNKSIRTSRKTGGCYPCLCSSG